MFTHDVQFTEFVESQVRQLESQPQIPRLTIRAVPVGHEEVQIFE